MRAYTPEAFFFVFIRVFLRTDRDVSKCCLIFLNCSLLDLLLETGESMGTEVILTTSLYSNDVFVCWIKDLSATSISKS